MSINAICMMIVTLVGVWGGFLFLILKLRKMSK